MMTPSSLAVLSIALAAATVGYTFVSASPIFNVHVGVCLENCCCKVCSSPSAEAYPYGLTNPAIQTNPNNPAVIGATCRIPVWSDRKYNDVYGNAAAAPPSLFWSALNVFGSNNPQTAPTTCDCCRLSVDTNCAEVAPIASAPKKIYVPSSELIEGTSAMIIAKVGVQLSSADYMELRNDTHCGYQNPKYLMRSSAGQLAASPLMDEANWHILKLPNHGCFRVCYYHANLTTPQWYYIGDVTIHQNPMTSLRYTLNPDDTLLPGNSVKWSFHGLPTAVLRLLSPFSDVAVLRSGVGCGGAIIRNTAAPGGTDGILTVPGVTPWCEPAVVPKITSQRPLNYIATKYSDCIVANRLNVPTLEWTMLLPATGTYTFCYTTNGTTYTLPTQVVVPVMNTLTQALDALYTATGGTGWKWSDGWMGTPCLRHGIRCDVGGNVLGVFLGRNNLAGTLPPAFFMSPLFNTLTHLKLDMNAIGGTLPREIGLLKSLRFLDLAQNQLTGVVPTTLRYAPIEGFYLSQNQFTGSIPSTFAALSVQWDKETQMSPYTALTVPPRCPTPIVICGDRGSTEAGSSVCGHPSITQIECKARGCCFNVQATLTFGGSSCFTQKDTSFVTHPPCQKFNCIRLPEPPPQ